MAEVITLSYKDSSALFALWMKAIFLYPVWLLPALAIVGYLFSSPLLFPVAYVAALVYGMLSYWSDLKKLNLVLTKNKLIIGMKQVDLAQLRTIGSIMSNRLHRKLKQHLVLTLQNGRSEILTLSRLSVEDLETMIRYIRNHFPDCKISSNVQSHIEAQRKLSPTVVIKFYQNQFIEQIHSAFNSQRMIWREDILRYFLAISSPIWLYLIFKTMEFGSKFAKYGQNQEVTEEILRKYYMLWGCIVHGGVYTTYGGLELLSSFFIIGIPAFFLVSLIFIVYARDFFCWKSFLLNGEYISFTTHYFLYPREIHLLWKDIKTVSIDNNQIMFDTGKVGLGLDLSKVNPIEKNTLLNAVKMNASNCTLESEELKSFQPAQQLSYTELWLKSLTHAPQDRNLLPLEIGHELKDGKFKIKRLIGAGGQGSVYLCSDRAGGPDVVTKESIFPIFVDKSLRKSAFEKFQNEAQTLLSLDHLNIAKTYDTFVEDNRGYFVLEYIKGTNLRLKAKQKPLDAKTVSDLVLSMCDVLQYLHSRNIIHRDFTPDNLILTEDLKIKLIDFNVAQNLNAGVTGTIVGKHSYISPEQFRGKACVQSDYYSMGATIYYLLTGEDPVPITQLTLPDTIAQGSNLANIIFKCTALDLAHRYKTPDEIRDDLNNEKIVIHLKDKKEEEAWLI